jgi:hypothetical protein
MGLRSRGHLLRGHGGIDEAPESIEQLPYFAVIHLVEVAVPQAHGAQRLGRCGTHDFVGLAPQNVASTRIANGHGHDYTGGAALPYRPQVPAQSRRE